VNTNQRTDIVIWSKLTRQVIIIELTVPWEERIEEAQRKRKRLKYEELIAECAERKWKTWSMPVEVSCKGFVCQSLWRMTKTLGVQDKKGLFTTQPCRRTVARFSVGVREFASLCVYSF
jgi:hypothetical protein